MSVSECCLKSIVVGTRMEYPLGGSRWGQAYKVDCCAGCGMECEPLSVCDGCGEIECKGECEYATS